MLTRSYVEGFSLSGADQACFEAMNAVPSQSSTPHAYRWYIHVAALSGVRALCNVAAAAPAAAAPAAAAAAEDDCDDLFGDDEEEEDEATVAARAAERKAKAAAAKAAKDAKKAAGKIQKTQCVFEIKPYEIETDLIALYETIKQTVTAADGGMQWGEACNLVPVAYGIKKLVCSVVIIDDLVCIDDIEEPINEMDDVQSIELCTMNRL
jgi:elongation factor 1-beta